MTNIKVPYGKGFQEAAAEGVSVELIDLSGSAFQADETETLIKAMDNPIGSQRLEELVNHDDRVLIVVNDHTRPGPSRIIAGEVIRRLRCAGLSREQIKFIVATGSHRAPTGDELNAILGEEIAKEYHVIIHNCTETENMEYLGESKHGVPIFVNKALTECTFCIVTGLISPHHSAGYSGGRKSIVPGLAGFETLKIHHSLPVRPFEPAMGFIYGNPFHEVALDVAQKVKTRFMVNAVQNPHKENIAFVAGDIVQAHMKGVDICREASEYILEDKADIVIVSPGGSPRDINLYQAQKALSVAEMIGSAGCTFILVAECKDGYGEGVLREWLKEADSPQEVVERFKLEGYNVGSNKAFMYARAMLKGEVIVVSDNLQKSELGEMMLSWAPNLQQALDNALKKKVPNKISVLPNAVNIIPKIKGENHEK